jgi:arylsulfatase A-like enzyme
MVDKSLPDFLCRVVHRYFLAYLILILTESCLSAANIEKPNIVFVLVDDMGYDSLRPDVTPFLKSLQNGGNLFQHISGFIKYPFYPILYSNQFILIGVDMTSYYTQQKCTPARASLLTGNLDL